MDVNKEHKPPEPTAEELRQREERSVYLGMCDAGRIEDRGTVLNYRLYRPELAEGEKAPVVTFFHGLGECGEDNERPITFTDGGNVWIRGQIEGWIPKSYVLIPQQTDNMDFNDPLWQENSLEIVHEIIMKLCLEENADPDRLYITGQSLGGYGTWNMNRLHPDTFAAVVTCCPAAVRGPAMNSVMDTDGIRACAAALKDKAVWLFHAEDDEGVPVQVTLDMRQLLLDAGRIENDTFRVTIYPEEMHYMHACWIPTYENRDMHNWLFRQHK